MSTNVSGKPEPRVYTRQDLNPVKWDPQCKIPSPFPLGTFWPVYVGNFWCGEFTEHATKVQEYFASKGLLVRMVFCRSAKDDLHFMYEKENNLYDFLVYFVRSEDADDAVSYCHREMYYGHRLNVFPGRTPITFDLSKSVKHTLVKVDKLGVTGQVFEQHVQNLSAARIDCVVLHSFKEFLVQYASVDDRNNAIRKCRLWTLEMMEAAEAKQRFLEQDVKQELLQRIQTDPLFMDMLPSDNILNALLNGSLPVIANDSWKTLNMHQMPNMHMRITKGGTVQQIIRRSAERALRLFGVQCDFLKIIPEAVKQARLERKMEKEQRRIEQFGDQIGSGSKWPRQRYNNMQNPKQAKQNKRMRYRMNKKDRKYIE